MDIDFQLGNQIFSLVRLLVALGAFSIFIWLCFDVVKTWDLDERSSTEKFKAAINIAWKAILVLFAIIFFFTLMSNSPKITLDYRDRQPNMAQEKELKKGNDWKEDPIAEQREKLEKQYEKTREGFHD